MTSTESTELHPADGRPPYAELARQLIAERADLFRVAAPREQRRLVQVPIPKVSDAPSGRRRRRGQLTLPLRPRVLDGGDRVGA